jgi:aspartate-semialdehyde dehydrogenase
MRIAITGATGNVGAAFVAVLAGDPAGQCWTCGRSRASGGLAA